MSDCEENQHPSLIQNGNILASQYEIVRRMFRHLSMKDLSTCCKVTINYRDLSPIPLTPRSADSGMRSGRW